LAARRKSGREMGRGRWLDLGHRGAFGRRVLVFGDGGHRGVWVCSIGCSASILCWDVNRAAWVYFMTDGLSSCARERKKGNRNFFCSRNG